MTILALYKVDNALGWERDATELACVSDDLAFKRMFNNREELDARFYNMDHCNYGDPLDQFGILNADDFVTDYNDELYDGGWWTLVFHVDDEFVKEVVTYGR